jgi:hypothetical protein
LIIGGGIANFTNVAETFRGIIRAISGFKDKLLEHNVKIYVRRGGPNYQEGLQMMVDCGVEFGLHIEVKKNILISPPGYLPPKNFLSKFFSEQILIKFLGFWTRDTFD